MELVQEFLSSSTIHGLSWISRTRRLSRLVWISAVFVGFISSGYLIYLSFYNWQQNPITTTIKTLPISQLTLPNVTVCPPKNLYLNLNYDYVQSSGFSLDNDTRMELFDYALDIVQEEFYKEMMKNLSKVVYSNRFHDWYYGYTLIEYPYYFYDTFNQLRIIVSTTASSGNISTQYFGEKFAADNVDESIYIKITVFNAPFSNNGTSIMFNIEKNTILELSDSDRMSFDGDIPADKMNFSKKFSPPKNKTIFRLDRRVSIDSINNMITMPGFRLTWKYNKEVEDWHKWAKDDMEFVRYYINFASLWVS